MKQTLWLALIVCFVWGCDRQVVPDPKSEGQLMTCAIRLRTIDSAKQVWAEKNQKTTNDTPTLDELGPFLRGVPVCPSGGNYSITRVGELTTCSIPEHTAYYKKSVPTQ